MNRPSNLPILALISTLFSMLSSTQDTLAQNVPCNSIIQPHINYSAQSTNRKLYPVVATLTLHTTERSQSSSSESIYYANGITMFGFNSQTGKYNGLKGRLVTAVVSNRAGINVTYIEDDTFRITPQLVFEVTVSPNGQLGVLWLLNGKRFLGRGPEVLTATCTSGGIITGTYGSAGGKNYTLTLFDGSPLDIPH